MSSRDHYIENYILTLKNLAKAGYPSLCATILCRCWTGLELISNYRLANNASALRFDATAMAAFDLYILERKGAL